VTSQKELVIQTQSKALMESNYTAKRCSFLVQDHLFLQHNLIEIRDYNWSAGSKVTSWGGFASMHGAIQSIIGHLATKCSTDRMSW
jgi:hypothetical protein